MAVDNTFSIDWKAGPVTVIDEVNALLKARGLIFALVETNSDEYEFALEELPK